MKITKRQLKRIIRETYQSYQHDIGGTFTIDDAEKLVMKHGLTMSSRELWEKHKGDNMHDVDQMIKDWKVRTGRR